ncbi:uncharacterized protein LOC111248082 [Varroa destructor]|uniref:Uncharacterized protein n=1 Tax=Varroa destructor TaxID=109461 RepID=A0A7M7M7K8_VARDE|nr:uncharacterized protein LOC111248082 [Varroa destructor]
MNTVGLIVLACCVTLIECAMLRTSVLLPLDQLNGTVTEPSPPLLGSTIPGAPGLSRPDATDTQNAQQKLNLTSKHQIARPLTDIHQHDHQIMSTSKPTFVRSDAKNAANQGHRDHVPIFMLSDVEKFGNLKAIVDSHPYDRI